LLEDVDGATTFAPKIHSTLALLAAARITVADISGILDRA
jgi:hypothetical protein